MLHVLIIEDEPFAQSELQRLLQNTGKEFQVLQFIESVEDAVEWLSSNHNPDVIFCDIQLADGLSFEIFKQIKVSIPVIFTTAFDAYAIEAFKVNSIDYLLKPIEQTALNNALNKLEGIREQYANGPKALSAKQLDALLNLVQNPTDYKTRILVKWADQLKFIPLSEVAYFFAEDNEVLLMTFEQKKYVVDYSLEQIIAMVEPRNFYRLNRSFIANKDAIGKVHKYFNSRLKIDLKPEPESDILVSRIKVAEFLSWMEQ